MKKAIWLLVMLAVSSNINAERFSVKKLYAGGGIAFNQGATGFQLLGGYNFDFRLNEDISSAVDFGYMDSGDFDGINNNGSRDGAKGLWVSMVERVPLTRRANMMARLGFDFGDDDGLLLGAGLEYKFDTRVSLAMEYVAREHIGGLQANVRVRF